MENPAKFVENAGEFVARNFERLLRWAYPGLLFLVLLELSKRGTLGEVAHAVPQVGPLWTLGVTGLVAGSAVYLFQSYVVGEFFSFLEFGLWEIDNHSRTLPFTDPNRQLSLVDRFALAVRRRWAGPHLDSWLNYAWATDHAAFITGWLPTAFYIVNRATKPDSSWLGSLAWWQVYAPALALIIGAVWVHARLNRVPFINGTASPTG